MGCRWQWGLVEDSGAPNIWSGRESLWKLPKWKAAFQIRSSPRQPVVSQSWERILALRDSSKQSYALISFPFLISFSLQIQLFLCLIRKSISSSDFCFYSAKLGPNWLKKCSLNWSRAAQMRFGQEGLHRVVQFHGASFSGAQGAEGTARGLTYFIHTRAHAHRGGGPVLHPPAL